MNYRGYTIEKMNPPRRRCSWKFWKVGAGRPGYARNLKEAERFIDNREQELVEALEENTGAQAPVTK